MEKVNQPKLIQNLFMLAFVIAFVFAGWLAGHILRFSMLAHDIQHPPVEEINPQIKNGLESEGIRRKIVLAIPAIGNFARDGSVVHDGFALESCVGNTYYTSLPAKCRSAEGKLVRVGNNKSNIIFVLPDK